MHVRFGHYAACKPPVAFPPNCSRPFIAIKLSIADDARTCDSLVMSKLVLSYRYDASFFKTNPNQIRDDFGLLSVAVETDRFSGKGGFWVQWQDVKEFGEALETYPIREDQPIAVQWGYDMQEGDDLILRIEIAPADKRGNLAVGFEIADDYEPRDRVRGSFLTNYPDLAAFRVGIEQLMNREAEEAVLSGQ